MSNNRREVSKFRDTRYPKKAQNNEMMNESKRKTTKYITDLWGAEQYYLRCNSD